MDRSRDAHCANRAFLAEGIAKAKDSGMQEDVIRDFLSKSIAAKLCGRFDVTDIVVKIRIEREKILDSIF